MVKSRTLINLVESRTPLMGKSQGLQLKRTLHCNLREFLFGNVQIGVTSQGLVFKASCMELGTFHETRSYLHYQAKFQICEWGRERFWEEKDRWNPIYKPMLGILPLLDVTLSGRAFFFFFSLFLCSVCVLDLFLCIYLPFSVCALQFIKELRSSFPLFLLLTDQFMGLFESVFLPQFLTSWSAVPHYLHFSDSWQVTPFLLRCGVL